RSRFPDDGRRGFAARAHPAWWRPWTTAEAAARTGGGPCAVRLPAEPRAAHHAGFAAAEGGAERDAGAVADGALVAHRQRRFAALRTHAHADPVASGQARGVHRHAGIGAAHRRHLVDAAVLFVEAVVDLAAEGVQF